MYHNQYNIFCLFSKLYLYQRIWWVLFGLEQQLLKSAYSLVGRLVSIWGKNWSLIGMPFIIALSWTMSVAKKICVQTVLCVTLIYSQPISCECFLMEENKNSVIKVLPENEKIIIHGPPSNPPKTIGKWNIPWTLIYLS